MVLSGAHGTPFSEAYDIDPRNAWDLGPPIHRELLQPSPRWPTVNLRNIEELTPVFPIRIGDDNFSSGIATNFHCGQATLLDVTNPTAQGSGLSSFGSE